MVYKLIAIILICLLYLYERVQYTLSIRSENNPIPENVKDVYDPQEYRKWQNYHREKARLGMLSGQIGFVVELVLLACNLYAAFAGLFRNTYFLQMLAVILLIVLSGLIDLPFSWYETMKVEEKYGFNRTTGKTFWLDQIKSLLITLVILIAVGSLLMWLHQTLGNWLILAFAVVMFVIILFIAFLYPVFRRVFNRFTPLEDEDLERKLTALLERHHYKVRAIQVMDASRRSTKANAFFSGFGRMKTIVLYDTLLETMNADEVCAVFAHEMGHGLHKDTLKNQILSFVQLLVIGVLAWLTLSFTEIYIPFGFDSINYGFALILIMRVEYAFLAPAFGLVINAFSRRAEFRADRQAVEEGYGELLVSALKKLAHRDYSNIAPDPLLVKLNYSHPPLSQRIDAIREEIKVKEG